MWVWSVFICVDVCIMCVCVCVCVHVMYVCVVCVCTCSVCVCVWQVSQYSILEMGVIFDSKLFPCWFGSVCFDCFTICVFQNEIKTKNKKTPKYELFSSNVDFLKWIFTLVIMSL